MDSNQYAPFILAYEGGKFIGSHEYVAPQSTRALCEEVNRQAIGEIVGSKTIPANAAVIGLCVAIPLSIEPSGGSGAKAAQPYANPHTGADGTQTL